MARVVWVGLLVVVIGCGGEADGPDGGADASRLDAAIDAPVDAGIDGGSVDAGADAPSDAPSDGGTDAPEDAGIDAATCPTALLVGGTDVVEQGWSTVMQAPATLSYGADHVRLETSTAAGAGSGGQLLLVRPGALTPGMPFRLEIVMQVESVTPHNQYDSAAAILGSFTTPFGAGVERSQMIYVDPGGLGWSDDSGSHTTPITDGAYHTYVLAVDATGTATVTIDGAPALTRTGFTVTGTIAIGDQTNDPSVDGAVRVRSVTLLCP